MDNKIDDSAFNVDSECTRNCCVEIKQKKPAQFAYTENENQVRNRMNIEHKLHAHLVQKFVISTLLAACSFLLMPVVSL